jgi:hypothetical protein
MNAYGTGEVQLHSFLTRRYKEISGQLNAQAAFSFM